MIEYTFARTTGIMMRSFVRVWENGTTIIHNSVENTYAECCKECNVFAIVPLEQAKVRLTKGHDEGCLVGEVEDLLNDIQRVISQK
jgi:hypothetical protein